MYAFRGRPRQHFGWVLSLFDSFFVSSGHSYPLHEGHCLTCMWLGCLAKFCLRDSPCLLRLGVRTACLAHHRIYLFYTFPQLLGIGRIAHGILQKIVVPLPWRLFFVSPKTSRSKLFGEFFVIIYKDAKNHNTNNQIVRFFSTNLRPSQSLLTFGLPPPYKA